MFLIFRYTHVEAEFSFITFNDLLDRIEDMICDVVKRVLESPHADIVKQLNPVSFFNEEYTPGYLNFVNHNLIYKYTFLEIYCTNKAI